MREIDKGSECVRGNMRSINGVTTETSIKWVIMWGIKKNHYTNLINIFTILSIRARYVCIHKPIHLAMHTNRIILYMRMYLLLGLILDNGKKEKEEKGKTNK